MELRDGIGSVSVWKFKHAFRARMHGDGDVDGGSEMRSDLAAAVFLCPLQPPCCMRPHIRKGGNT